MVPDSRLAAIPPSWLRLLTGAVSACALLSGCGGTGTGDSDYSNGINRKLRFSLPQYGSGAAGGSVAVTVAEGHLHATHCGYSPGPYTGLPERSCDTGGYGIDSVVSSSCAGAGCKVPSAGIENGMVVAQVFAEAAGQARLKITLRLLNGSEVTDEFDVPFVKVTDLKVICGQSFPGGANQVCPGPHAILDGAGIQFVVQPVAIDAAGAPAEVAPALFRIRVEGTGVKTLGYNASATWPASTSVFTDGPGSGTVYFSVGGFERAYPVRVVSAAEVRSLALHWLRRPASGYDFQAGWFSNKPDVAADPVMGDPTPTTISLNPDAGLAGFAPRQPLADAKLGLVATLADGTFALGGGGVLTSNSPSVLVVNHSEGARFGPAGSPQWWPYFDLTPAGAGTATIVGTLGTANFAYELQVVP